jgi:hypothetical protein
MLSSVLNYFVIRDWWHGPFLTATSSIRAT